MDHRRQFLTQIRQPRKMEFLTINGILTCDTAAGQESQALVMMWAGEASAAAARLRQKFIISR